jgi:hypothetical protein
MTVNFSAWLGAGAALDSQSRAAQAWRRIQDKPSSVAFKTAAGATLAAQTVRIESDSMASPAESAAGMAPRRKVTIFGIRGHETLTDTNMAEGYRFIWSGDEYRIMDVILTIGEVQGLAEATG